MSQEVKIQQLKAELAGFSNQPAAFLNNPAATVADLFDGYDTTKKPEEQTSTNLVRFAQLLKTLNPNYTVMNIVNATEQGKKMKLSTFLENQLKIYLKNENIDNDNAIASAKQVVYGILFGRQAKGGMDRLGMGIERKMHFGMSVSRRKYDLLDTIPVSDLLDKNLNPGLLYPELKNILGESYDDAKIKGAIAGIEARGQNYTTLNEVLTELLGTQTVKLLNEFREADLTVESQQIEKIGFFKEKLKRASTYFGDLAKASHPEIKKILENEHVEGFGNLAWSSLKHTCLAIILNTIGNQKIDQKTGEAKFGFGLDNWRDGGEWFKRLGILAGGGAAIATGTAGVAAGAIFSPIGLAIGVPISATYAAIRESHLSEIKRSFDRFMTYKPNFEIFAKKLAAGDTTLSGQIEMLRTKVEDKKNKVFFEVQFLKKDIKDTKSDSPVEHILIKPGKEGKINFQSLNQDIIAAIKDGTKEIKHGKKVLYKIKYDEENSRVIVE